MRPFDYAPARWVAESGDFWFVYTGTEKEDNRSGRPVLDGQVTIGEEKFDCKVEFSGYYGVAFYKKEDWEKWKYVEENALKCDECAQCVQCEDCRNCVSCVECAICVSYDYDIPGIMWGHCKFGKEKLVVVVSDSEFLERKEEITFIRYPFEPESEEETDVRWKIPWMMN